MNRSIAVMDAIERPVRSRAHIRGEIQQIILDRLPPQLRRFYKRSAIVKQAIVFEEFLYKTSSSLEFYANADTLQHRVLQIAIRMFVQRSRKLFVYFDMRA
ncbi:hypothetical protein ACHAWO_009919 [Cyclotella atomus]|uniref:Uncharacterized protein n=1 Tax=Cyclotella atomus TaxID=382360 RepID=A0ABD3N5B3_9STRA